MTQIFSRGIWLQIAKALQLWLSYPWNQRKNPFQLSLRRVSKCQKWYSVSVGTVSWLWPRGLVGHVIRVPATDGSLGIIHFTWEILTRRNDIVRFGLESIKLDSPDRVQTQKYCSKDNYKHLCTTNVNPFCQSLCFLSRHPATSNEACLPPFETTVHWEIVWNTAKKKKNVSQLWLSSHHSF